MELVTGHCLREPAQTPGNERQKFCRVLDRLPDAAHMQKERERDSVLMHSAGVDVKIDSKAQQHVWCSSRGRSAAWLECSSQRASAAAISACRTTRPLTVDQEGGKEPSQMSQFRTSDGTSTTCRRTPRRFTEGCRLSVAHACLVLLLLPAALAQRRGGTMMGGASSSGGNGGGVFGIRRAPPPPAYGSSGGDADDGSRGGGLATILSGNSGSSRGGGLSTSDGGSQLGTLSAGESSSPAASSLLGGSQAGYLSGSSNSMGSGSAMTSMSGSSTSMGSGSTIASGSTSESSASMGSGMAIASESVSGSSAGMGSGLAGGSVSSSGPFSSGTAGRGTSPWMSSGASSSYASPSQGDFTSSGRQSAPSGSGYGNLEDTSPSQGYVSAGPGDLSPSYRASGGGSPSQGYVTSSSGRGSPPSYGSSSPSQGYVTSSSEGWSPSSYGTSGRDSPSQGYVMYSSGGGSPSSYGSSVGSSPSQGYVTASSGGGSPSSYGSSGSSSPSQGYVTSSGQGGSPLSAASPGASSLAAQPKTTSTAISSSPPAGMDSTNSPSPPASPPPDATPSPSSGAVTSVSGGAACGEGGLANCAGGNSDPVMYGFAGRSFNFMGAPGKIYNIVSTQNMQISMKLRLAQMWDHNGTNMEALGFMYRNYQVLIALDADDSVKVYKQGRSLKPRKTAQHHAWRFDDGAYIEIIWELYKPGLGNTIEIETDVLRMTVWQTPAGIVDEGGMVLQAWLNFGITLVAPPANGLMHGIVGGTYDRFLAGESAVSDPESQLYLPTDDNFHGRYNESEYEMSDFWATNFTANLFGVSNPGYAGPMEGRASLEVDSMEDAQFPVSARACSYCDVKLTVSGDLHTT